jgi:chemotaxis protein methyltransferase CheR
VSNNEVQLKPALIAGATLSAISFELGCREISEREFCRFRDLIYGEAGIWLSHTKIALLTGRLAKRLRHHGLKSFRQYYDLVLDSAEERVHMLDAISTNETRFFREPQHFELLKSCIFPRWGREAAMGRHSRRIRVLSAGCSTGQEPYSLAMVLREHFPAASGWQIEIIATDISTRVLETACSGIWPAAKASEFPRHYLMAFMLKGFAEQSGKIKAAPEIRSLIQFFRMNLNASCYPLTGKFDLIFCRNVLIYFDGSSREQVVRRLAGFLAPDGYFFLGHAESLHTMNGFMQTVLPTVYTWKHGWENDAEP